jgi:hypothetical protein
MFEQTEKTAFLPLKKILDDRKLRKSLRPEYIAACRFFSSPLFDRTKTLDSGIELEILDPLNDISKTNLSFGEICDSRAEFLCRKAIEENKEIQVLWSGGIDSTLALIALYKILEKTNETNRLEILLSEESIAEHATFFADVLKPKLKFTKFSPPLYDYLNPKKIIVTGEHGDQIFGSDKAKFHVITKQAFRPYKEILPFVIARKLGSNKDVEQIIEYLAPQVKKSPVKIETLYDYLWWMNFSLKWQHVSLRLIYSASDLDLKLNENMIHFFSAKNFQNWSISNHERKIKKTWNSYKYTAKQYIYDFHSDADYLHNKEKEQSLKDAIILPPKFGEIFRRPFRKLFLRV